MESVFCIGELLIDFLCINKGSDLKEGTEFIKKAGGAPANVCVGIQNMGVVAHFGGAVGADSFGDFLEDTLLKYHVNTDNLIKRQEFNTTLAFVSLKEDGERDFKFVRGADSQYTFSHIKKEVLEECNVFHFGSATAFLGGDLKRTYFDVLDYAVLNNKFISFDPNFRKDLFLNQEEKFVSDCKRFIEKVDLLKVSEEEAKLLTGEEKIEEAAKKLNEIGTKFVLVTLGSKGTLLANNKQLEYIETMPVKMVDATGAGDAFIGAILALIAKNITLSKDISIEQMKEFVQFGNFVGGKTVQSYGAMESIPHYEDIKEEYAKLNF